MIRKVFVHLVASLMSFLRLMIKISWAVENWTSTRNKYPSMWSQSQIF